MPYCDECGKESEKLINWGHLSLCKECSDEWEKTRPNKPPKDNYEVTFNPEFYHYAMYEIETGNIVILYLPEERVFRTLNHEILHRIIHKIVGLRPCWQYDNIETHVDDSCCALEVQ